MYIDKYWAILILYVDKYQVVFIHACWQVLSYIYSCMLTSIKLSWLISGHKYLAIFIHVPWQVSSYLYSFLVTSIKLSLVHAWGGALHVKLSLFVGGDYIDRCVWMVTALIIVYGDWVDNFLWMVTALIIVCGWWLHWSLFVYGVCIDRCLWMVTALIVVGGTWLRWLLFVDGDCIDHYLWMVTALIVICGWWLHCLAVLRSQACGTRCVRPSPCGATPPGTPSSAATLSATTGRLSWLSLATRKALSCDCLFASGENWEGLFVQM